MPAMFAAGELSCKQSHRDDRLYSARLLLHSCGLRSTETSLGLRYHAPAEVEEFSAGLTIPLQNPPAIQLHREVNVVSACHPGHPA